MANNGWETQPLGELTENFDSIRVPVRQAHRKPGPYPYYGASGVVDRVDGYLFDGEYLLIAEDGENLRTRQTPIAFIANGKFWVNNHAHIVRGNGRATTRFLEYALSRTDISGYLTGSTMPKLTQGNMNRIGVLTPPRAVQDSIVDILGTLDNKIELNRCMNQTLEGIARAIFKSWFVDFDPVRAKMDGRQPARMDADTAALFSDEFQESELGPIPKRWGVARLGEHVDVERGLNYTGSGLSPVGIPMHNLNSIQEGGGYKHEGLKFYIGEYRDKHKVAPGDLIVTNTEQGFDGLLIGYAAIVPHCYGTKGIFSHHIYRVRVNSISPLTPRYLLYVLNSRRMHNYVSGFSNGTTINMLPIDALEKPLVVIPSSKTVARFSETAEMHAARCECSLSESRRLATLRNTLLPKLLSGQIRVPEAEKEIEEVL